jgi:hypothetical protein
MGQALATETGLFHEKSPAEIIATVTFPIFD